MGARKPNGLNRIIEKKPAEKSLKIPMKYSESVNRRTDNTMAKRKKKTIYKTLHKKLKIE
jgi:hypothetical protein